MTQMSMPIFGTNFQTLKGYLFWFNRRSDGTNHWSNGTYFMMDIEYHTLIMSISMLMALVDLHVSS